MSNNLASAFVLGYQDGITRGELTSGQIAHEHPEYAFNEVDAYGQGTVDATRSDDFRYRFAVHDLGLLTTDEVATMLGISRRRVEALIEAKRLPADKISRDWLIRSEDVEFVKERRPGRPSKHCD